MSRWITITADHLKAAGHGHIVDRAGSTATGAGDPIAETIQDVTARIRRAAAAGNSLDADTTKIPASLKAVAVRMALYALMQRIGLALNEDERETRRSDESDLKRLTDNRLRVELPDVADGAGEMQEPGRSVEAVNVPRRQTGRERTSGL